MDNSYYYIPQELSGMFNEITIDQSPYHDTFKHWWNRGVDTIRQDNFATETKRIMSGLAETKILADDLKHYVSSQLETVREKKQVFVSEIRDTTDQDSIYNDLLAIWDKSRPLTESIHYSMELLEGHKPENSDEKFTKAEMLYHRVKGIRKALERSQLSYAKYLGLARCRSFYWEHDQLCYYDEAQSSVPLVSWDRIQNYSIKELITMGHQQHHAAYIRYCYYMKEEDNTMHEAYDLVRDELGRLASLTYVMPDSVRSFNKSANNHIEKLRNR